MTSFRAVIAILIVLLIPNSIILQRNVSAEESEALYGVEDDLLDDEDDAAVDIEDEDEQDDLHQYTSDYESQVEAEADAATDEEGDGPKESSDVETALMFIKPTSTDLPAGSTVELLAGVWNKGSVDYVADTIDCTFVHPHDYSYHIVNFTRHQYLVRVEGGRHVSLKYKFTIRDDLADRPVGLIVTLNYTNNAGDVFTSVLHNDSVMVREPHDGFDGETFFLYVVLVALLMLTMVGAQQVFSSIKRKHMPKPRVVEVGTRRSDVDYDWIPPQTQRHISLTSSSSPKSHQRKTRRNRASIDD